MAKTLLSGNISNKQSYNPLVGAPNVKRVPAVCQRAPNVSYGGRCRKSVHDQHSFSREGIERERHSLKPRGVLRFADGLPNLPAGANLRT